MSILIYQLNKDKNKNLRNIYLLAKSIEAPKKKNQNSVVAQYQRLQHCEQRWAST
jgi:DNA topoisomerase VI subunit A